MNMTEELKDQIDVEERRDGGKSLIAKAGTELTDDQLEKVAGGYGFPEGLHAYDENPEDLTEDEVNFYLQHQNESAEDYERALNARFPGSYC